MNGRLHELKSWASYFEHLAMGIKDFEIRENDRDFIEGDFLRFREIADQFPGPGQGELVAKYTGRELIRRIVFVYHNLHGSPKLPGLEAGFVLLQLGSVTPAEWAALRDKIALPPPASSVKHRRISFWQYDTETEAQAFARKAAETPGFEDVWRQGGYSSMPEKVESHLTAALVGAKGTAFQSVVVSLVEAIRALR